MKTDKKVVISVVIPTLNRHKVLENTINNLLSGEYVPDEIVVVDQSEEIFDTSKHAEWRGIVKVFREEFCSSAKARNEGVKKAKNDIILFCDDDIEVDFETIGKIYREMLNNNVALVSTINCEQNAIYGFKPGISEGLRRFVGCLCGTQSYMGKGGYIIRWSMKGHYEQGITYLHKTEWAYGFFFSARKSLMEKWDVWFDENLIKYAFAEDMDFSYRYCRSAQIEHLETIVDPRLYVHHLVSREWRMPSEEAILYGYINRWYLSYKLFPKEWWYRIGMVWSDVLYTLLVYKKKEKKLGFRAMVTTYKQRKNLRNGIINR